VKTGTADVIVVGAGPAGLAAATRLRHRGVREVVVLDREEEGGGVPRHCHHPSFGLTEFGRPMGGPRYAAALLRRAAGQNVVVRTGTTVLEVGRESLPYVVSTSPSGLRRWEAEAVILATGCRERPRSARLIPGSRAPGVFTTGELQQFTYLHRVRVGSRAVIVGAEHVSFSAAMTLADIGIECAGIVTAHAGHQSHPALRLWATRFGRTPLLAGHRVASIEGRGRVEAVVLETPEGNRTIETDTVIVTGDWVAEGSLALRSGLSRDTRNGGRPEVDGDGATATAGIFAAGSVVLPGESAASAVRAGSAVAENVVRYLRRAVSNGSELGVRWDSSIRWVSPELTRPGEATPLRLRVDQWLERPTVVFRSNGRVVDTVKVRRMIPGRTYTLDASWAGRLGNGIREVEVSIGMGW